MIKLLYKLLYSWYSWLVIWWISMHHMITGDEVEQKLGVALLILLALLILTRRTP